MSDLLPWLVCSPEYGEVVPVLDDGTGPMEYGCDVVHVEAETKQDALYFGVMLLKRQGASYLDHAENPYAGVRVESQVCPTHGMPEWSSSDKCWICRPCEAAWESAVLSDAGATPVEEGAPESAPKSSS